MRAPRFLIGYSCCGVTREAFERQGVEAWTCDVRPARDGSPRHLQCDIWDVAEDDWDGGLFHPMCTYLTVSAAWAFNDPDYDRYPGVGYHQKIKPGTLTGEARREARREAIKGFRRILDLPYPKAIENPGASFISKAIRPADQLIQPYQFGDDASKLTGLWLDRLPPLTPTKRIPGRVVNGKERWANQTDSGQNRVSPSEDRWLERSETYAGIAAAMGGQWGRWLMDGAPAMARTLFAFAPEQQEAEG
ncbi:hypothetical protein [Rhizorhapis sp.]|uniref:hypothetical protein n=1 Tax=Rhizorhapis sp. TaxID=1968842 RepID=UPI002B4823CF|nr:hypothetical protein [Rhizorhapis sp.]HKR17678.1 hypothetical protein [Rhizorhapis sp.]